MKEAKNSTVAMWYGVIDSVRVGLDLRSPLYLTVSDWKYYRLHPSLKIW